MRSFDQDEAALQRRTLAAFLALTNQVPDWAGRLVLLAASDEAAPFALATIAAGGAVLWTCANETLLRESSLTGLIDFQVTTLSEALRILKNEIRKGLPVSVGVLDTAAPVWAEAVTRGVQPEALWAAQHQAAAAAILVERGATTLQVPKELATVDDVAQGWRSRRDGDTALLSSAEQLPEPVRSDALRWLRAAPRLFPRSLTRCCAAAWRIQT